MVRKTGLRPCKPASASALWFPQRPCFLNRNIRGQVVLGFQVQQQRGYVLLHDVAALSAPSRQWASRAHDARNVRSVSPAFPSYKEACGEIPAPAWACAAADNRPLQGPEGVLPGAEDGG